MADVGVCDNLNSKKGVSTEKECLFQQISSSKCPNEKPSNVTHILQLLEKLRMKSDLEPNIDFKKSFKYTNV